MIFAKGSLKTWAHKTMMSQTILLLQNVLIFLTLSLIYQEIVCTNVKWILWSTRDVTFGTPMEILNGSLSFQMCAARCQSTPYCVSVHVNKASSKCELSSYYPPEKRMVAKTQTGWNVYYMADLVNDACYDWTSEENIQKYTVGETALCESYPFHKQTFGSNEDYPHSGGCWCVQHKGCYESSSRNYKGTWSMTKSGIQCQRWDSQTPHNHQMTSASMFPQDSSMYAARFYCRDPDNSGELWCYTTNPSVKREICGIPKCSP